uniref:GRIP domain-containing protein n=1 Tax=Electrophorus electricus TaxID=8005 RepID=A0A4W4H5X4_ELEEL
CLQRDTDMASGPSTPYLGKSKLDTLSKEDLIKFAKKQMAVMQKLKAKCADLEKRVEMLKALPSENSDDTVIQLTERMDAVLLEKAETQQTLVLLRKENEKIKMQAEVSSSMENLLQLQEKLDNVNKEHMEKIKILEKDFEISEAKHREELKLIKQMESEKNENEAIQRQRLIEEFNSNIETVRQQYENQVHNLQHDLEFAKKAHTTEIEARVETHQMALEKSHENLKNLQDEISRLSKQHEDDIRVLEEQLEMNAAHFEMERERFLSELSEQQVLKESYLQDVEEEEEEGNSRTQKASGITHTSDSLTLEEPHERLRLTLQDLQSQNAMLQEELIFLSNVKTELESNLKHIKEEFMMEREELEFKINELQMMKGDTDTCLEKEVHVLNELKTVSLDKHEQELQKLQELHKTEMKELETRVLCNAEHEKEAIIQELKELQYRCTVLEEEKNIVISEYEHTKEILSNLELELGDRTADFVNQYSAMKEHAAMSIQELQEKLYEKDSVIKNLKSVAQTSVNSSDKCKEIHITVASDKEHRLENMRTDLDHMVEECKFKEKDERMNKIKAVAVKARKELENSKKEVRHKQLSSEREDMVAHIETLQSNVRQLEAQALEMQKLKSGLEKDLEAEKITKEQKTKDHQSAVADLEETRALLQKQEQQLQQTEQELEQLRKDAQQSTLLDMEMADYERLVKELNVQLLEKDKLLEKQENLAQAQRDREEKLSQEMESLKSLVDIGEEKNSKMKQLLVKTKKDLADAKKEVSSMMIQSSLKGELEGSLQQLDGYKIQCSELLADRHRLQEQLKSLSDQHLKAVGTFQCNVNTLQEQLSSTKAELCSTVSEFEGYKVRVHNVLKQQKTKSSAPCDGEFSKQEREHMDSMMEQLRSKLQENQLHLQSSTAELQQLQTEHDLLLERHNKMLQQTIAKEAELRERLLTLHSENSALRSEHSQSVAQLTAQADALRSSFREQVHHLQDEQRSTVEMLQQQISRLEAQLFQLQKEPSSTGSAPVQQIRKSLPDRKLADMAVCELQNMAREEGEGMETAEAELVSTSDSAPPTLEQLLSSPDPKQGRRSPFVWQVEPTKDDLSQRLSTATRSLEHMNSLLHESEATNAVLMEQISVLKSELRRLERNQEREKSVANLEYLKNVVLRFMLLPAGSEKQALLPVIHTLLQLSPDEKSKLAAIAQGEEEAAHSGRSGWTSYLHSWSGIR